MAFLEFNTSKRGYLRKGVSVSDYMKMSNLPENRRATLAAVAAKLGISTATVSRALHKPYLLNPQTVERVRAMVDQMRYRPNFLARHLKTGRTHNVLVVVPSFSPFFLEIFRGIERMANKIGYFAIIAQGGRDSNLEGEYFDQASSGRADGVLLLSAAQIGRTRTHKYKLPPIVSVFDAEPGIDFPSVRIDHRAAAIAATRHLIGLGHRHIAHISGNAGSWMALQRREGFLHAMDLAGYEVPEHAAVGGDFTFEMGEQSMASLLSLRQLPTAVFAVNDDAATGAIKCILQAGLRIPEDISVIGFGDQRLARIYNPALTTVGVPTFDLGYFGMAKLMQMINGEAFSHDQVLETHIIQRATTAPPRAAGVEN